MTKKYRIRKGANSLKLQIHQPPRPKKSGQGMSKERWITDQYYRDWTDIIWKILNDYIDLVEDDDLLTQLQDFPRAFKAAIQRIINELEIVHELPKDKSIKDVTNLVEFGNIDDENLPLTKCVCDTEFGLWDHQLGVYQDHPTQCPECARALYFSFELRVWEVVE
jgi:hypothetical protein